jgi:hypothetical protein
MILFTGTTVHAGRTVVCRLESLGHDVEDRYSQVSKDFTANSGRKSESFRDFLLRAPSGRTADCIAGLPFRERHRS